MKYLIESVYEHYYTFTVEAESFEEAMEKLGRGEIESEDDNIGDYIIDQHYYVGIGEDEDDMDFIEIEG